LLAQEPIDGIEILVLDFGRGSRPPLRGTEHPSVRVLSVDRVASYGEALALGTAQARGGVVAFVEEHVAVRPGWAEALLRAHEGPWAAVCGEIHPGDSERATALRIELVSRNRWSPPARRGESVILRWQNCSYKRSALLAYGDELPLLFDSEGTLFRRLRRDGHALYIEPDAKADHAHEEAWSDFLPGTFYSNRLSAAAALEATRAGTFGKGLAVAKTLTGLMRWPLVLLARTRALPDPDRWLPVAYRNAGHVLEYYAVAATANLVGVLFGRGPSGAQFLDFELNSERHALSGEPLERLPSP
jgi:hypothetical protein